MQCFHGVDSDSNSLGGYLSDLLGPFFYVKISVFQILIVVHNSLNVN